MIGFELKNDDKKILVGVEEGNTTIIFSRVKNQNMDEIHLHIGGTDKAKSRSITWMSEDLSIDDKFVIKVSDFSSPTSPIKENDIKLTDLVIEGKLRAYFGLKKELEEAGLI